MPITLDLVLDDARDAPPKPRGPKAKAWSEPRPVNHPEASERALDREMSLVASSVRCCNWAAASYHAVRCANIYAELDAGVLHAIASAGYGDAPSPLGDWSSGAWIAWCVHQATRQELGQGTWKPCAAEEWCPPNPPLSEYHARDYEYMREVFCRG